MNNSFYKLPIHFDALLHDEEALPMCSELESIDQHIELLLTTCPGEHTFNKSYGCRIWDMDFERVVSRQKWEDDFKKHIEEAILKFEPRLRNAEIAIQVMDVVKEDQVLQTTAIKKKVQVFVNAHLVSNEESCGFNYTLYLGPLATE